MNSFRKISRFSNDDIESLVDISSLNTILSFKDNSNFDPEWFNNFRLFKKVSGDCKIDPTFYCERGYNNRNMITKWVTNFYMFTRDNGMIFDEYSEYTSIKRISGYLMNLIL